MEKVMKDLESDQTIAHACYVADNFYAYYKDSGKPLKDAIKIYNFVPIYDKWCLQCGMKDAKYRCGKCNSVFFCSVECQRIAWPIHKRHCGRRLFTNCIACGTIVSESKLECEKCPVKYCSERCKDRLHKAHTDFDCDYFAKTFSYYKLKN